MSSITGAFGFESPRAALREAKPTFLAPNPNAPYRYLFLDLNAYFASVEQQENPELRGKPVGVVPMVADGTVLIAASYEAKAFGAKTLTKVAEARKLCPEIILVEGDHKKYTEYHERIVQAVETVVPVERVCSIDEMRIRLLESEADEQSARSLAMRIKDAIREQVGECMTCSIGLAPNAFLAKTASDMEKPNGLVLLDSGNMHERLSMLNLTDFCGINRRMAVRLNLGGIYTAKQLLAASERDLRTAFGSVHGARWWYLLRGYDLPEDEGSRKSLGNSHVLSPEFRTRDGAHQVLMRLIQKATARLRREGLAARSLAFMCVGKKTKWDIHMRIQPSYDTLAFIEKLREAWQTCEIREPIQVGVTFGHFIPIGQMTLSIFDEENCRHKLATAVDTLNGKFGRNSILPAGLLKAKDSAPERIAFQKVALFDEGASAESGSSA